MTKAVIDLGTNTFKCVIASVEDGGISILKDYSLAVRLGEGLTQSGTIPEEASLRALEALRSILADCRQHHATRVLCVGAMTLRSASNAESFISLIRAETGISVKVLDGSEEAALAWQAALEGCEPAEGETVVMDIGGGSTELVRGFSTPQSTHSLPIGALTLTSLFLHGDPPVPKALEAARARIRSLIPDDITSCFSGHVIACGGTVTNFASVGLHLNQFDAQRIHDSRMAVEDVDALLDRFAQMTLDHLRQMPGLQPQRASIIIGGGIILSTILAAMGVQDFTVSTCGIRHALLHRPGEPFQT